MSMKQLKPAWNAGVLALGHSLKKVYPQCALVQGGTWDLGFYQEISVSGGLDGQAIPLIEEALRGVVKDNCELRSMSMLPQNAVEYLRHHGENRLADRVEGTEGEVIFGRMGSLHELVDGEMVPSTAEIGVIKVLRVEPAGEGYRIVATSAPDKNTLKENLRIIEEAEARDHRRLGEEMGLWWKEEEWNWGPQGVLLRHNLWMWWKEAVTTLGAGIVKMTGPWDGHTPPLENHVRAARKWNRDGIAELLVVKQKVNSRGMLGRLGQTSHAIHLFPPPAQVHERLISSLQFIDQAIKLFGFEHQFYLCNGGKKANRKRQQTDLLSDVAKACKIDFETGESQDLFPGAILEARVKDARHREWSCGRIGVTNDKAGSEAIFINLMGSVERHAALLVETHKGHLPLWLAPEPVRILSVGQKGIEKAQNLQNILQAKGIEAGLDATNEKLGHRIYQAEKQRIPYVVVLGEQECSNETVTVRPLGYDPIRGLKTEEFAHGLNQEMKEKALPGKMVAIRKIRV